MTAVEALRRLAAIVARAHGLSVGELARIEHPPARLTRARDMLCFIACDLTRCSRVLAADAFHMTPYLVWKAHRRHLQRQDKYPAVAAITTLFVQGIAREEQFLEVLCAAVAAEDARRRHAAGQVRGAGLYRASLRPEFEPRRREALRLFHDNGGRELVAEQNRARAAARRSEGVQP